MVPPQPPDQPFFSVVADIGAAATDNDPLRQVGACRVNLTDALARGVGEAVERFSLAAHPSSGHRVAAAVEFGDTALDFPAACLGDTAALDMSLTWYPGWSLASGERVMVPAGLCRLPGPRRNSSTLVRPDALRRRGRRGPGIRAAQRAAGGQRAGRGVRGVGVAAAGLPGGP